MLAIPGMMAAATFLTVLVSLLDSFLSDVKFTSSSSTFSIINCSKFVLKDRCAMFQANKSGGLRGASRSCPRHVLLRSLPRCVCVPRASQFYSFLLTITPFPPLTRQPHPTSSTGPATDWRSKESSRTCTPVTLVVRAPPHSKNTNKCCHTTCCITANVVIPSQGAGAEPRYAFSACHQRQEEQGL